MNLSKLLFFLSIIICHNSFAEFSSEKTLFTMEKNYHPENILVINTRIDNQCKFVKVNNSNIDFYWLMNRQIRKEIHPMIRSQIQEKVKFGNLNSLLDAFKIQLNDLSELKHDLEDISLEVTSSIINGNCQIKSILNLGAVHKYRKLNLKRTYCEVTTNLVGIPNGCKFIDLQGQDDDTGEPLKVRFMGK